LVNKATELAEYVCESNDRVTETNQSIDKELNDLLDIIYDEIKDITATSLKDLTVKDCDVNEDDIILHEIIIKPNIEPIKQKTRGIPYSFREEFRKTLNEMIEAGLIINSKSPWCSPVRLVRKKDGSIRVCVDYRKLNNVTVKDSYPLPRIEDLFSRLSQAKIFTTLDLASGYYQVRMKQESRQYTAFSCEFGFYEYVVLPMGLTNACATFQRLMNTVLGDLIGKICLVYLDDIIIYSNTPKEHLDHIRMVIARLREHNLKIKVSKCKFAQRRIEYLSHIIENGHIMPNPAKVEALFRATRPHTVKQVQSFLGLVSYYRKFIRDCSSIASPSIKLTEKDSEFKWNEECQKAFDELRGHLTTVNKVLILPNYDEPFRIEADASKHGVGGVLSQQRGKRWQPVAYLSKHLSKVERNYSTSK
jgi:hypothetical protein